MKQTESTVCASGLQTSGFRKTTEPCGRLEISLLGFVLTVRTMGRMIFSSLSLCIKQYTQSLRPHPGIWKSAICHRSTEPQLRQRKKREIVMLNLKTKEQQQHQQKW